MNTHMNPKLEVSAMDDRFFGVPSPDGGSELNLCRGLRSFPRPRYLEMSAIRADRCHPSGFVNWDEGKITRLDEVFTS